MEPYIWEQVFIQNPLPTAPDNSQQQNQVKSDFWATLQRKVKENNMQWVPTIISSTVSLG